jgi:Uncharacterized conserved protein
MSGLTRTSADLSPRRRRILYHAWHRGTREMDLVLGRFVDAAIGDLDEAELGTLEDVLEIDDRALFAWIVGKETPPEGPASPMIRRICAFHAAHPVAGD